MKSINIKRGTLVLLVLSSMFLQACVTIRLGVRGKVPGAEGSAEVYIQPHPQAHH